jgi:hypothetical protein
MIRTTSRFGSSFAVTIALAVTLAAPVDLAGKSLGKGYDPMLAALVTALDAQGIDVVPGRARDLVFRKELRPRLAKLAGFPIASTAAANSGDWTGPFATGAFGYVAAYRPSSDEVPRTVVDHATEERIFLENWGRAEQTARVFVAFTRADAESAQKVASVLRSEGYVVFTYLRGQEPAPWASPDVVGRLFKEAGHHLVIDSPSARESSGVVFEALALTRLKETTRRASPGTGGRCADILVGR